MSDMFLTRKEKLVIIIEAVIYIALVILASYYTIFGDMFIRMVPMLYFLGIFGGILFDKPIVTIILGATSIFTFGYLVEGSFTWSILWLAGYSVLMIGFGEVTGYILNILYDNFKLRSFIKYYHKIAYVVGVIVCILIPLFLNNVVNSNMITYLIARKNIDKYINENYAYSEYYMTDIKYVPSYSGGMYEFIALVDSSEVALNYSKNEIADVNLNKRKDTLNKMANAEINILLRKNQLTNLDVVCRYDYTKVATIPDIIRITIDNVKETNISDVVKFISVIKEWDKFSKIDRIDISIDNSHVYISKKDLTEKEITETYLLNGMKQELLSNKEGR